MGLTPEWRDSGPGLRREGSGFTGFAVGEGLGAGMKRDGEDSEEDFGAAGLIEEGLAVVGFAVADELTAGTKPEGGANGVGLGAGIKPTTGGRDKGLE